MKKIFTLLFTCIPVISFSQDLSLGLRAYYPFNGNANDASGNNNNAIFNNATLTSDAQGNPNSAYHFNGIDNFIQIPNSPSLNMGNQLSIALKVRPTGFYTGPCHGNSIVMKANTDFLPGTYLVRFDDNAYTFGINCATPVVDVLHQNFYASVATVPSPGYTPYIQVNQWYNVVVTNDGTTSSLYINCELKGSFPQSVSSFTNSFDLFFGKLDNAQYPYWLNGDLDEVRIYDRALTRDEVNLYGGCSSVANCNNWLSLPSYPSYVDLGDLDIPGTQLTIEATINRTQPYSSGTGDFNDGDIVSKHTGPGDVNYLLRPNHAYITTSDGFFATPNTCDIELNKTYQLAMVYDGTTLKYYRNGFLASQVPATGNLFQSNLPARIGLYSNITIENFLGYVNEVRIWNVARTQSQIQAYMNAPLPNPTTQTGLLAYYTFDNLINKQGNSSWNGVLSGAASINATNTTCIFLPDSCFGTIPCNLVINTNITDLSVCMGATVQLEATGSATDYSWTPSANLSDSTISNPVATVNTDVSYVVTATAGSCKKKDTINIHAFPPPFANAGPDKSITSGGQVTLDGSGSDSATILWTPPGTLTGANSFTPIAKPTVTTTYTLTVTDNNNCTAIDDVKVFVKDVPCGNALDPVHAFTPNADGINDKWLAVYGNSCTVQVSVKVYNRYGSPVYENDNYQNDWEGTYKGKTLPDGTYYYVNIYKLSDGRRITREGDVTILR